MSTEENTSTSNNQKSDDKNPIWDYFRKDDKKQKYAVCTWCKKAISAEYGNTSNLRKHIQSKHKLEFAELCKLTASRPSKRSQTETTQSGETDDGPSSSKHRKIDSFFVERKWPPTDKRQKECTQKLAQMICLDLQPISIVEDKGFKDFVSCLQPSFNIPDRRVLRNNIIPELYRSQKSYLQEKLNEIKSFAITLDHWTSTAQDAYMAVTAHFLSEDFTINDYCLNVRHMPQSHDAKNIADELCSCLGEWIPDYEEKLLQIYTVTDNAANVKAAMRRLSPEKIKSMFCFAHTLQLVVNDAVGAFPEFGRVIKKAKVIVNHFHKSAKDSHKLTEIQKTLNIKQHKLKNESPTQWNSLYYLMDRIVEQRQAVTVVLASNDKVNNLRNHEWKTAESYVKVLKPFEDVTSMMSASRYPTLSMVIPVLNVLKQQMDGSEMDDFGRKICGNINERWPDYESNLDLAIPALLDPRFKEYAFSNDGAKESAVQETVDLMYHNTNSVQANQAIGFGSTSDESSGQSSTQEASTRSETASGSGNVWGIFKKMVAKKRASHTQGESREVIKQNLQKEFSIFCNDDLLEPDKSPFDWWKRNCRLYPNVSKLAQTYLSIPATSVPSERLFSKAGLVITNRRSCLEPNFAEQLVFLGHNLKQ